MTATDTLQEDFNQVRDITVIGAGPVGLSAAFWASMREASVRLIDSLPDLGGQLTTLYPEKWIFDVLGHPKILAVDLVEKLKEQSITPFGTPVHLETTAEEIKWEPDPEDPERKIVVLKTDRGELRSRAVIIAGGHGAFEPKKLPTLDTDSWEGRGAHYLVRNKADFADRDVIIVGGGDSACDWVINLLDIAKSITLVHRREGFRAHEVTVKQIDEAAAAGKIQVKVPYQIREIQGSEKIEGVELFHSEDDSTSEQLKCDDLLLQLGFKTALGPLREWDLEISKGALVVDHVMKTNLDQVWACGDITTFDGKIKLIATGFAEAAIAVGQAVHSFRPEMKLQPKYSTNTGVPVS